MRPVTDDELVGVARGASWRIVDSVREFDHGKDRAIETVSACVRLLFCGGTGNELLVRLCKRLNVDQPRVFIEHEMKRDPNVTFGFGNVPGEPSEHSTSVTLGELRNRLCLVTIHGAYRDEFTWQELVTETGYKLLGVHADNQVPLAFDEIALYEVANGTKIVPFMIRTIGVAVVRASKEIMDRAGRDIDLPELTYSVKGQRVAAIEIRERAILQRMLRAQAQQRAS